MGNVEEKYESVKISKETVNLVRENKKKTGVPISIFIEKLIKKALKK